MFFQQIEIQRKLRVVYFKLIEFLLCIIKNKYKLGVWLCVC